MGLGAQVCEEKAVEWQLLLLVALVMAIVTVRVFARLVESEYDVAIRVRKAHNKACRRRELKRNLRIESASRSARAVPDEADVAEDASSA